jgi:hypothetical protein
VSDNKEDKIDLSEEVHFDQQWNKPRYMIVFVLTGAIVKNDIQFLI